MSWSHTLSCLLLMSEWRVNPPLLVSTFREFSLSSPTRKGSQMRWNSEISKKTIDADSTQQRQFCLHIHESEHIIPNRGLRNLTR